MAETNFELNPDNVHPGYRLGKKLGEDSSFVVYAADNEVTGRTEAFKFLKKGVPASRLEDEARNLAKVGNHNYIREMLHAELDAEMPHLILEFCNTSLATELNLNDEHKLEWKNAAGIVEKVLDALAYAHSKEVVHGDISPSRVLINDGNIKLSGFSLDQSDRENGSQVKYVTPEHWNHTALTPKTDIHQAGQLLWELITGKAYMERSHKDTVAKYDAPKWIDDIIDKATQAKPELRYESAAEMRAEIMKGLEGKFDVPGFKELAKMYALHAAKKLASGFKSFGEWYKYNKRSVASSVPGIAGAAAALLLIGIVASGIKSCVRNDSIQADNRYKAAIEAVSSVDSNTYVVAVSKNDVAYLRINSLLSSNAVPDRIKLPIEVNTLLGSHDGKIFYYGIEERQDADTGQGKYPQICVYDLNTRTVSNMVDYSSREARWTKDSQVAAGMLAQKDDGTVKPLLQIPRGFSKNWYEVKTNTLVEADSCKLLQVQHPRALGTTGMSIDKDSYGKVCIYSAEGKHMATANMEALAVFMHSVTNKP